MRRFWLGVTMVGVLATGSLLIGAAPAFAHEHRLVAGKYSFVVGWGDEPTYSGFKNSAQLILSDAANKPITDLGDTLNVEISTGDQKVTLPMGADFKVGAYGDPGDYRAWIVPTRPGTYTFHFTGTIHGDKIDESFTSSETTFDSVKNAGEVEFPAKDPSNGDLATNLAQLNPRVDNAAALAKTGGASAKSAKDRASSAQTLAVVALVAAIVIGGAGVASGMTARRRQ